MSVVSVSPSVVAALSSSPDRSPDWPNTCHSVENLQTGLTGSLLIGLVWLSCNREDDF